MSKALIGGIVPVMKLQASLIPYYTGSLDGIIGDKSIKACDVVLANTKLKLDSSHWRAWSPDRKAVAVMQIVCHGAGIDAGKIDGLVGEQTRYAFNLLMSGKTKETWRDSKLSGKAPEADPGEKDTSQLKTQNAWPLQKDVIKFFGPMGQNIASIPVQWPMVLSYDKAKKVKTMSVHEKVADSATRVMKRIASHYSPEEIISLGLHLWGGSFNIRKMRGGSAWSMHSWAIALDFDPDHNQLNWNKTKARLAQSDAVQFWKLWEEENWVSLGRTSDFDWMHVQAAKVR